MINTDYYMNIACQAANKSTCLKRNVGAIIVKDKQVIAEGCNGGDPHYRNCKEVVNKKNFCYWKLKAYEYAAKRVIKESSEAFQIIKKESRALCLSICAERRAIYEVMGKIDLNNTEMYCTTYPCPTCAKLIRYVGIKRVYYIHDYNPDIPICEETERIFSEAVIEQVEVKAHGEMKNVGIRTNYEYEIQQNKV